MASVAQTPRVTMAPSRVSRAAGRPSWFGKALAAIGVALFSSLVLPWFVAQTGRVVQDRQKERELKLTLIEGIIQPMTSAIIRADLFASGLISPGADATAAMGYGSVLEHWLAASSKAGAQLETYLEGGDGSNAAVLSKWLSLFSSVTDYVRLSTDLEQFDRAAATERIRLTLTGCFPAVVNDVDWAVLAGGRQTDGYNREFHNLRWELLSARDSLVDHLRSARLTGFVRHLIDIRGTGHHAGTRCGVPRGTVRWRPS